MKLEKKLLALVIVLAVIAAALIFIVCTNHVVDLKLYPRNSTYLDLREEEISISHYQKLTRVLPDCTIRWKIPALGGRLDSETTHITAPNLTVADAQALVHARKLQTVQAQGCTNFQAIETLMQLRPDVQVTYTVPLGDTQYPQDTRQITVETITEEEIRTLPYLPQLESVVVRSTQDQPDYTQLRNYCLNSGIAFSLSLGEDIIPLDADTVEITGLKDHERYLLDYLSHMTRLHLISPQTDAQGLKNLTQQYPDIQITWEVDLFGQRISGQDIPPEIDLSQVTVTSLEELEAAMACLPGAKTLFLGKQDLDNDDLAAYRDRVRDQYKVVWTITLGHWDDPKKAAKQSMRTDIVRFFPAWDGIEFNDNPQATDPRQNMTYNLRYCEDLIAVDVGHLGVSETSWLEGLHNLEYLILAHTGITSLDGIENCKKLKFLEIHWTGVRTLEPLKGLTALEDLNFGQCWPDVSALLEMPWLKHVYMIGGNRGDAWKISQACPDTRVVVTGTATVASGWRTLPGYYAMRDALDAPYMN